MLCHPAAFLNERSLGDKMPYKDDHEDRATIAQIRRHWMRKGLDRRNKKVPFEGTRICLLNSWKKMLSKSHPQRRPGNTKAPKSMLCHPATFLNERSLGEKMPYKDDH
jgi:hypothetical protein